MLMIESMFIQSQRLAFPSSLPSDTHTLIYIYMYRHAYALDSAQLGYTACPQTAPRDERRRKEIECTDSSRSQKNKEGERPCRFRCTIIFTLTSTSTSIFRSSSFGSFFFADIIIMGVQQSILQAFNASPASTPVRFIKVSIQDEQAVLATSVPPRGSVKEDFALIGEKAQISTTEPCYLLYRLDGNNAWLFITYVPDAAKVRDKMLYSSSKSRLVKALGETNFTDTIHATSPSDLTPRAYELHLAALAAPKPLTEKEKAMAEVRAAEYEASKEGSMRGTGGGVRGGAGPLSGVMGVGKGLVWGEGIEQALDGLKQDGKLVGLTIDPKSPTDLTLAVNGSSTLAQFHTHLPPSSPQYTFFSYRPTDASAESTPIVLFVYTCPPKSPIKMRMIYSSSVGSLVANVKTKVGIEVGKKIESSEPDSLTESELLSEIKPLISTNPIRSFSVPTPAPTRPSGVAPNASASSFSGSTTESTNILPSSMPLSSDQPTSSGGPNGGNTFARPRGPARRPVGGRVAAARSAFEAANQ